MAERNESLPIGAEPIAEELETGAGPDRDRSRRRRRVIRWGIAAKARCRGLGIAPKRYGPGIYLPLTFERRATMLGSSAGSGPA